MKLDEQAWQVFDTTLSALQAFAQTFGKPPNVGFIAELHVIRHLGLALPVDNNQAGYDAIAPDGTRYQVKYRADGTPIVDMNNFDFDYLVLVNLDGTYQVSGMWRIHVNTVEPLTTYREKFRKYQTTQYKIKTYSERLK